MRWSADLSTILGLCVLLASVLAVFFGRMDAQWLAILVPPCGLAIGMRQRLALPTINNLHVDTPVGTAMIQKLDTLAPTVHENASKLNTIQQALAEVKDSVATRF